MIIIIYTATISNKGSGVSEWVGGFTSLDGKYLFCYTSSELTLSSGRLSPGTPNIYDGSQNTNL